MKRKIKCCLKEILLFTWEDYFGVTLRAMAWHGVISVGIGVNALLEQIVRQSHYWLFSSSIWLGAGASGCQLVWFRWNTIVLLFSSFFGEIHDHGCSIVEFWHLKKPVFREGTMIGHCRERRSGKDGLQELVWFNDFVAESQPLFFIFGYIHRRSAVKCVEQIAFSPLRWKKVVEISPVPCRNDAIVVDQFPQRNPQGRVELIFSDFSIWLPYSFKRSGPVVTVRSQTHHTLENQTSYHSLSYNSKLWSRNLPISSKATEAWRNRPRTEKFIRPLDQP